ncbi:sensor histidine kinase [Myxococcus faecalis]|uniref:sensor histidine kinase n=1 Tax=Myxococcus faecalis TaxID=3115646 RepID=UPI0038D02FD0
MSSRRARVYAACQAGGWGLYALINAVLSVLSVVMMQRPDEQFARRMLWLVAMSLSGVLITHVARVRLGFREWARLSLSRLTPRVLLVCLAMGATQSVVAHVLSRFVFRIQGFEDFSLTNVIFGGAFWSVVMMMWLLTYFAVHFVERARTAEHERLQQHIASQTSELRFLKAQLQPHFLFNCLNSVRALIVEDPARAQQAVTHLSSLLRYALASKDAETVPLGRELQVVRDYLSLEAIRLEERLRVREDVSPEALAVPVPAMLVQTLVENAIKHGIAPSPEGGAVTVQAHVREGSLILEVANTPAPVGTPPAPHSGGVGLHNASERLRLLCGTTASLQLDQTGSALTTARVRIPLPS